MSALPILKLPILVLMKILRIIDVETVIPISLCSRKMYHLVKTFRDKSDTLRLKMDGIDLRVQLATPDGNYHEVEVVAGTSETAEWVKIDGHLVPIDRSRKHHGWNTYWDDKVKRMQSIMEYLSDLFGIKNVTTIIVTRGTMRLLDILKERQENDYELVIYHQLSEKESHFILENHPAKVLRIEGFSHNFPIAKHLKSIDSLIVGSKLSITLDDLLDMDCVELVLMGNRLTGTGLKRILQHWAIDGFRRLKYLRLRVWDFNLEDVLRDLDGLTYTRMAGKRTYRSNIEYPTFGHLLITRNDGVVASFDYYRHVGIVQFGVWPDSKGNTN